MTGQAIGPGGEPLATETVAELVLSVWAVADALPLLLFLLVLLLLWRAASGLGASSSLEVMLLLWEETEAPLLERRPEDWPSAADRSVKTSKVPSKMDVAETLTPAKPVNSSIIFGDFLFVLRFRLLTRS